MTIEGDVLLTLHPELGYADLSLEGDTERDLELDQTLETAVLVSLGTNRIADPDDEIPDGTENLQGYWGDVFTEESLGSRLWLIGRSYTLPQILARAEEYTQEALKWMKDVSLVGKIDVVAERVGDKELKLNITIFRPVGGELPLTYFYNWEQQILRRAG